MLEPELRTKDYGFDVPNFMYNRGHSKQFEIIDNPYAGAPSDEKMGREVSTNSNGANSSNFSTDWLTNIAVNFIDQNKNNPFFYVISYPDPHGPNNVRAPYDAMFTSNNFEIPTTFRTGAIPNENTGSFEKANWTINSGRNKRSEAQIKEILPQYFGMVKCIDDNIKKLLDKLSDEGILDNTIIVFTSDHGDLMGEHGRENKGNPYEASVLIPFLIRYPAIINPNTVINTAFNNADLMDTLIHIAGITNFDETTTTGKSFKNVFTGEDFNVTENGISLNGITFSNLNNWLASFSDRFKLVLEKPTNGRKKIPWLIDLQEDPSETTNFIDFSSGKAKTGYKAIAKTLAEKLKEYYTQYLNTNRIVLEQLDNLINDDINSETSVLFFK